MSKKKHPWVGDFEAKPEAIAPSCEGDSLKSEGRVSPARANLPKLIEAITDELAGARERGDFIIQFSDIFIETALLPELALAEEELERARGLWRPVVPRGSR